MGIAGAAVALVAGAAALVIAPGVFALWGYKLAVKPRSPSSRWSGRWYRLAHGRHGAPAPDRRSAPAQLMLVLALPALRAAWTPVDSCVIPKGQSARTVADTVDRDFPGGQGSSPITVVADPELPAAVATRRIDALAGVRSVSEPRALDARPAQIDVLARGDAEGATARGLVATIRDVSGAALVGGAAAEFVDQQDAIASSLPLAVALMVGLTMLVLWLMTGSIVLPIKAIVMNALTVGASLGILTLVFQDGRFEGLLGYTGNGGVEPTDFLVAAALVFALSTDYGVFLLGRIKEARDGGLDRPRGGGRRRRAHRRGRDRGGDPARGGDRRVHHVLDLLHPADRRRHRGRRRDRRLHRARAAGAVADGPARALELVVAAAADAPSRALRAARGAGHLSDDAVDERHGTDDPAAWMHRGANAGGTVGERSRQPSSSSSKAGSSTRGTGPSETAHGPGSRQSRNGSPDQ